MNKVIKFKAISGHENLIGKTYRIVETEEGLFKDIDTGVEIVDCYYGHFYYIEKLNIKGLVDAESAFIQGENELEWFGEIKVLSITKYKAVGKMLSEKEIDKSKIDIHFK